MPDAVLYPISDADLGKRVKAKYPDAESYSKLPDEELGRMVKQKYPQYQKPVLTEAQFKEGLKGKADPNWQNPEASLQDDLVENVAYAAAGSGAAKALPIVAKPLMKAGGKIIDFASHPATAEAAGVLHPGVGFALRLTGRLKKALGLAFEKEAPQAPEPFRPNPNIARTTKFGGPAPEPYGPAGKILPRKGFTPPEEVAPQAPERFKPSSTTASRMRYGGAKEPDYSPASGPVKRISGKPANAPARVESAEAPKGATEVIAPKGQAAASKPPFVNNSAARHVAARNITIAKEMNAAGVKAGNVAKLSDSHWQEFAKANGFEKPNAASVKQIIGEMKRLESSMPSPKGRLTPPQ
jgi:hypothetical protein